MKTPMQEVNEQFFASNQAKKNEHKHQNKAIILYKNKFGRPIYKAGHTVTPFKNNAKKHTFVSEKYLEEVRKRYPNAEVVTV